MKFSIYLNRRVFVMFTYVLTCHMAFPAYLHLCICMSYGVFFFLFLFLFSFLFFFFFFFFVSLLMYLHVTWRFLSICTCIFLQPFTTLPLIVFFSVTESLYIFVYMNGRHILLYITTELKVSWINSEPFINSLRRFKLRTDSL